MNAGRILRRAGHDSEALRGQIAPVDPDEINVWPASRFFIRFWRPGIIGMTHWRLIFVDPEVMRGDSDRLGRLVAHELVHVRQYLEMGYLRFNATYLYEYWVGRLRGKRPRDAYLDISLEREARELTERTVM